MPLTKGGSEKTFSKNVKELYDANKTKSEGKKRPRNQILAIAYAEKRKSKGKK